MSFSGIKDSAAKTNDNNKPSSSSSIVNNELTKSKNSMKKEMNFSNADILNNILGSSSSSKTLTTNKAVKTLNLIDSDDDDDIKTNKRANSRTIFNNNNSTIHNIQISNNKPPINNFNATTNMKQSTINLVNTKSITPKNELKLSSSASSGDNTNVKKKGRERLPSDMKQLYSDSLNKYSTSQKTRVNPKTLQHIDETSNDGEPKKRKRGVIDVTDSGNGIVDADEYTVLKAIEKKEKKISKRFIAPEEDEPDTDESKEDPLDYIDERNDINNDELDDEVDAEKHEISVNGTVSKRKYKLRKDRTYVIDELSDNDADDNYHEGDESGDGDDNGDEYNDVNGDDSINEDADESDAEIVEGEVINSDEEEEDDEEDEEEDMIDEKDIANETIIEEDIESDDKEEDEEGEEGEENNNKSEDMQPITTTTTTTTTVDDNDNSILDDIISGGGGSGDGGNITETKPVDNNNDTATTITIETEIKEKEQDVDVVVVVPVDITIPDDNKNKKNKDTDDNISITDRLKEFKKFLVAIMNEQIDNESFIASKVDYNQLEIHNYMSSVFEIIKAIVSPDAPNKTIPLIVRIPPENVWIGNADSKKYKNIESYMFKVVKYVTSFSFEALSKTSPICFICDDEKCPTPQKYYILKTHLRIPLKNNNATATVASPPSYKEETLEHIMCATSLRFLTSIMFIRLYKQLLIQDITDVVSDVKEELADNNDSIDTTTTTTPNQLFKLCIGRMLKNNEYISTRAEEIRDIMSYFYCMIPENTSRKIQKLLMEKNPSLSLKRESIDFWLNKNLITQSSAEKKKKLSSSSTSTTATTTTTTAASSSDGASKKKRTSSKTTATDKNTKTKTDKKQNNTQKSNKKQKK